MGSRELRGSDFRRGRRHRYPRGPRRGAFPVALVLSESPPVPGKPRLLRPARIFVRNSPQSPRGNRRELSAGTNYFASLLVVSLMIVYRIANDRILESRARSWYLKIVRSKKS